MTVVVDFQVDFEKTDDGNRVILFKRWEADDRWEIRDMIEYADADVGQTANQVIALIQKEAWEISNVYMGTASVWVKDLKTDEGRARFVAKFIKDTVIKAA